MKAAVLQFPGSNCDRDMYTALKNAGANVTMVWHKDAALPEGVDVVGVPGGFSYGDYLRCGAIAANSPVVAALKKHVERGGYAFGICNGFQVLTEAHLLPGALLRNSGLKYICRTVELAVETTDSPYTAAYAQGQHIGIPIAHHDGNFTRRCRHAGTCSKVRGAWPSAISTIPMVRIVPLPASCQQTAVCWA